jgi:hypothetical protein
MASGSNSESSAICSKDAMAPCSDSCSGLTTLPDAAQTLIYSLLVIHLSNHLEQRGYQLLRHGWREFNRVATINGLHVDLCLLNPNADVATK